MKAYYADQYFKLWQGDSYGGLNAITENTRRHSVDCIVTSPPYYGLRDYGTGYWVPDSGHDPDCQHLGAKKKTRYDYSLASSPIQQGSRIGTDAEVGMWKSVCPDCDAIRVDQQIGLEQTPDEYLRKLVEVFSKAAFFMPPTGTIWVNLGDTYINRELVGIPWKFAMSMQHAGFKLIADIIWSKPNPQPFSVKHRPSTAHEYIFMFGLSDKNYYGYDDVKEPMATSSIDRMKSPRIGENNKSHSGQYAVVQAEYTQQEQEGFRNMRTVWEIPTEAFPGAHYAVYPRELVKRCILAGCPEGGTVLDPFIGSGTTAVVARQLSRRCIGIDLNPTYCYDAYRRYSGRNLVLEEAGQIPLFDLEVAV